MEEHRPKQKRTRVVSTAIDERGVEERRFSAM
jgi:hypothetical protein